MVASTINTHTIYHLEPIILQEYTAIEGTHTMVGTKLLALGFVVLLSIGLANAARVARYSSASGVGT